MSNGESSKKGWRAVVTSIAEKQLHRIQSEDRERVELVIIDMEENPFRGDIVKLGGGGNRWRRRIGNYRLIYNILYEERIVFIYDVRRRTSSTY